MSLQEEFLTGVGVDWLQDWTWQDSLCAHSAWQSVIQRKGARALPKRPLADLLIGAVAIRHDGLLTRNGRDFSSSKTHRGLKNEPQDLSFRLNDTSRAATIAAIF